MEIIDAHLHFSNREGFKATARDIAQVEYSAKGLGGEFAEANVVAGISMTVARRSHRQPDFLELNLEDGTLDCLAACIGVNAEGLQKDKNELLNIERALDSERAVGLKIYPGYSPYYAYDPIYEPVYRLAAKYDAPVAIHCGDTSSPHGLLKYAHPLTIDEVAVRHPDIRFIICHLGDPWVMDTAELISKNPNVYTDVSGLIAGNGSRIEKLRNTRLFMDHVQRGLVYAEGYDKVLFGTDWPLVPIGQYVEFVKEIIPEAFWDDVFYHNALKVFPKLKSFLQGG